MSSVEGSLGGLAPEFRPVDLESDGPVRLRSRWARALSWPWLLAAALWIVADITAATTTGRLPADVVVVPVMIGVVIGLRRIGATVDADALTVHGPWRTQRVLWAAVARLEIDRDARLESAVHVWRRGADQPTAVTATWNAPRAELDAFLAAAAGPVAAHGITVEER